MDLLVNVRPNFSYLQKKINTERILGSSVKGTAGREIIWIVHKKAVYFLVVGAGHHNMLHEIFHISGCARKSHEADRRPAKAQLFTYEMFMVAIANKVPSSSQFPWVQMNSEQGHDVAKHT